MGGVQSSLNKVANNPMDLNIQNKDKAEKRRISAQKKLEKKQDKAQRKADKAAKKKKKKENKVEKNVPPPITPAPPVRIHETDHVSTVKTILKKQLLNDSETFILNQILFSVEFFRNHLGDLLEAAQLNKREQAEQTKKLAQYCKRVLIIDRIIETMEKRLVYEFRRGPLKGIPQTLQRLTKYIVFENIEIIKQSEVEDLNGIYSKIEDTTGRPSLKIVFDQDDKFNKVDSNEHVGFYRLRHSEIISSSKYGQTYFYDNHDKFDDADDDDDDDNDDDDEEISRTTQIKPNRKIRDSIAVQKPESKRIQRQVLMQSSQTSSSTPSPSSSEYDYTYINNINSHRPINEMRTTLAADEPLNAVRVPQSCFINVKMKQEEDEDDDEETYTKKPNLIKQSFHSKTFFYYFTNVFKYILAPKLGFEKAEIETATWKGASIFVEPFEIIPAIQCKWPDKVAYDFDKRQRYSMKIPGNDKCYQWPSKEVIKHVINKQCYIIPNGYAPKEGGNPERDFEWQIVFPLAEQLLESNLSNAQLKIYILFKILIKTFIEPLIEDKYNLTDHVRHHLFWQFERQYPLMSDDNLGERLIHILNSLLERIGKTSLPDYFLPKRNLLYNIPSRVLIAVHEGLYRITEFPVRHLIIALRNLHVIDRSFYPKLNYKRLYESLTLDAIMLLNPQLAAQKKKELKETPPPSDSTNVVIALGAIGLSEQQANQDKRVKQRVRFNEIKIKRRKESVESIGEFVVDKRMDKQRRQVIFELLIPHYIEMAKRSGNFGSFEQSIRYLEQVEVFCSILADDNYDIQSFIGEVKQIQERINAAKVAKSREISNGPATAPPLPRRESLMDPKQQRRVTLARKSVTIHEVEDDPYTNIELMRGSSTAILPADFNDSDDDVPSPSTSMPNGKITNGPRKSILTKGGNRPNGILIERVQVHVHREASIDDKNEDLAHGNKIKEYTNNTIKTKPAVNIANRRKSSTKFVQITNGLDSDDSDEDEAENTSF